MSEPNTEAGVQRHNETRVPAVPSGVPPEQAMQSAHRHPASGDQTMDRMLNEALGRAARQLKIDPETGLLLPCASPVADEGAPAAEGPPASTAADATVFKTKNTLKQEE